MQRGTLCRTNLALLGVVVIWSLLIASVYAADGNIAPDYREDVLAVYGKVILILVAVLNTLLGYIYVSGQKATQAQIESLKKKIDDVYSKEDHDKLCKARTGYGK
ncbi:MAG: hypothetical protein IT388_11960 [Nitrospirales bacterium]|nr:hypothetical protein [Nitrospirales bacterium]